ncbi:MAG TPA: TPM domain-containing protein, partial [Candidatus Dormibacteraeota bacterium]|nr:TPM domain-containing protein [Candidatus Dormibacteraeota bacterium]
MSGLVRALAAVESTRSQVEGFLAKYLKGTGAPARLVAVAVAIALLTTGALAAARLQLPPHGDRSVHDLAGVLDPGTIEVMERHHTELYRKTGAAIVVVTVPRLEDETLADFAVRVGTEWGVGKKGDDRGIVVAVTTEEPHVFVSTGYGVESFLPDGRVGAILDRYVVAALRSKDFSTALLQASNALV